MGASKMGLDDEEILPAFEALQALHSLSVGRDDGELCDGKEIGNIKIGDCKAPVSPAILNLHTAVRVQDPARLESALVAASDVGVVDEELLPAFEVLLEVTGHATASS